MALGRGSGACCAFQVMSRLRCAIWAAARYTACIYM